MKPLVDEQEKKVADDSNHLNAIVTSNMTLGEKQDKVKDMNDKNVKETVNNIYGSLADHEQEVKKEENKTGNVFSV